jgi:hypothetical protein
VCALHSVDAAGNFVKLNRVVLLRLLLLLTAQKMRRVAKELGENLGDDELQVCALLLRVDSLAAASDCGCRALGYDRRVRPEPRRRDRHGRVLHDHEAVHRVLSSADNSNSTATSK